ncbi:MAG: serine/threonine-protein kinase [Acidobacteriota bacterium]
MSTDTVTRPEGGEEPKGGGGVRRGAALGRYTVLEAIGTGGMGNVFAAWDPELQRRVAVKVLHADLMLSDAESRRRAHERLRLEAQAAARLNHPNVVTMHDVGSVDDRIFIAMELVQGQTLKSWAKEPRPWRQTLEVYRGAGRGLAALHKAGLVHRDFKPGNVMMAEDGQVKILDFGLATGIGAELAEGSAPPAAAGIATPAPRLTSVGKRLGTPRYMSPEQVLGQTIDRRSDQFSFCVSLYEALYGELPAADGAGGGAPKGPQSPERRPLEPPLDTVVPRRVHRVLERGLRVDPEERYPSMDELIAELRVESPARRHRTLAAVAVVALAIPAYFGLRTPSVDCRASGRHLETLWAESRRADLRRIVEAEGTSRSVSTAAACWRRSDPLHFHASPTGPEAGSMPAVSPRGLGHVSRQDSQETRVRGTSWRGTLWAARTHFSVPGS